MLTSCDACFEQTIQLTELAIVEFEVLSVHDTSAQQSIDLLLFYHRSTTELKQQFINHVKRPHQKKGISHVQLDIQLVSRLFAVLLQMSRNHNWLRNTLGSEEMFSRDPRHPIAHTLGEFFDALEGVVEECMRSFDSAECSAGSLSKLLDCQEPLPETVQDCQEKGSSNFKTPPSEEPQESGTMDCQDPNETDDVIYIEDNVGQVLDFDM